jgi:hypothetical protein
MTISCFDEYVCKSHSAKILFFQLFIFLFSIVICLFYYHYHFSFSCFSLVICLVYFIYCLLSIFLYVSIIASFLCNQATVSLGLA